MRTARLLALVCLFVVTLFATTGCSWIRGACASVMPAISKVHGYVHDASMAVDQAEAAFGAIDLTPEQRKQVREAIEKARAALRVTDASLEASTDACTAPDALTIMKDFLQLWKAITGLLAMHSQTLGAAPGVSIVADPAIVLEAKARGVL